MKILVNYDGHSDDCIDAAFNFFADELTELLIHTTIPPSPYCSALEMCWYDPSYTEIIDQDYYTKKTFDKHKEIQANHPEISVKPVLLRATPAHGIVSACKNNNPDLLILDRGNRMFNIFGIGSDVWSQVRNECHKPLLEIKKVNLYE